MFRLVKLCEVCKHSYYRLILAAPNDLLDMLCCRLLGKVGTDECECDAYEFTWFWLKSADAKCFIAAVFTIVAISLTVYFLS